MNRVASLSPFKTKVLLIGLVLTNLSLIGCGFLAAEVGDSLPKCQSDYEPAFGYEPEDQTVAAGSNATFTVTAYGSKGATLFQWTKNKVEIPGERSSTLVLKNVKLSDDSTMYRCVLTNCHGRNEMTSRAALLRVL